MQISKHRRPLGWLTLALLASVFQPAFAQQAAQPALGAEPAELGDLTSAVRHAQLQRKGGDLVGATKTLSQLVLVAPDDPRVLGEYGKTLVDQGRSDDALAFLERAIELQPNDWMLYSAQGVAYDQKGDYRAAEGSYGRALQIDPDEPTVLSNAALSRMQAGDLDGAERYLLRAEPHGQDYPRIAQNLAMVQALKALTLKTGVAPVQAEGTAPPQNAAPVSSQPLAAPSPPAPAAARRPPASLTGIQALEANPNVVIQKLPKDDKAGKVTAKVPVKTAAKPAAMADRMAADKPAPTLSLRPALSGGAKAEP